MTNVAILGASNKPERMSHRALHLLNSKGYNSIPVNPNEDTINGESCYSSLNSCPLEIDTVTVYVRPATLKSEVDSIIRCKPCRVILNPGTEDRSVVRRLESAGIKVESACTIVLLNTNQF
ncbi:MAG: CoA-binding protein [Thiotrichales bacterium]|jgi:hypothetical protein|nr:CoA-binding protein [Thiotrichales bacterium]MBT7870648.1 CoA-binding protein [Thiotrichales bacterium]